MRYMTPDMTIQVPSFLKTRMVILDWIHSVNAIGRWILNLPSVGKPSKITILGQIEINAKARIILK